MHFLQLFVDTKYKKIDNRIEMLLTNIAQSHHYAQGGFAMGLMDKFKDFMGVAEDDMDEEELLEEEEDSDYDEEDRPAEAAAPLFSDNDNVSARGNKVVNIHATTQLQVVLVRPEQFSDAGPIADHLNAKRTVVLNLEAANADLKRRLVDFLSGVAYANSGQIKKVANSTYIITPYNVGVMGDSLLDELENNGVYF